MDYSLPSWLGALAGMAVAVVLYVPVIRIVERRLRQRHGPVTLEQRAALPVRPVDAARLESVPADLTRHGRDRRRRSYRHPRLICV